MPHERAAGASTAPAGMDPAFYALSKLRRRRFDEAVDQCSTLLRENNRDQAIWYIKTRALTLSNWVRERVWAYQCCFGFVQSLSLVLVLDLLLLCPISVYPLGFVCICHFSSFASGRRRDGNRV